MQRDPARHRVVDRAVLYEGAPVARRLPDHVEVHGIVADPSTLSALVRLAALHLVGPESLAPRGVPAERVARLRGREVLFRGVAGRDDADAARQQRDRGPGVDGIDVELEPVDAGMILLAERV